MLRKVDIERIREQDIVEYAKTKLKLKAQGTSHFACCPFHKEKTPSFSISRSRGIYKCFGCGEIGSIIDLAMHFEQARFSVACKILATFFGLEVIEVLEEEEAEDISNKGIERAIVANTEAQKIFQKDFYAHVPAKSYIIRKRGYKTKEECDYWGIGYSSGVIPGIEEEVDHAGMMSENGNLLFGNRITFPIHDVMGNIVGFSARTMGDSKIKYINTKENIAFIKSKLLYNLHRAKKAIKKNKQFILMEGPTDVHAIHRLGVRSAIASCGTSFTEDQCKLLGLYSKEGYIMTDGDKAGRKSAVRSIGIFIKNSFKITVIQLPEGEDPDSLISKHGEKFENYCTEHEPISYVYEYYLKEKEDEEKAIEEVIAMIAECKSRLNREIYLKKLAFVSQFSIQSLYPILKECVAKSYFSQKF